MTQLVTQSVIDAFFDGVHSDPFSVLGMHETDLGVEIRTLLPDANRVIVLDRENGKTVTELACLDERGFFAGIVPNCFGAMKHKLSKILIVFIQLLTI